MTVENLKNILPNNFKVAELINENKLVKLEQFYNDKIISNYFIDLDYSNKDVDIKKYQELFLSNRFFNAPGYLQWNYYLIFLRDTLSKETKKEIEKDESYARKFVFSSSELKDYFKYEKTISHEEDDIVSKWKEKLSSVELQEVFSGENYNKAIPRFIAGKAKKIKELKAINSSPNESENFVLNKIDEIKLNDSYRPYPENREYIFGKVNLISGPNGTGKTSLLEAAELVITGNNDRNIDSDKSSKQVIAKYSTNKGFYKDEFSNSIPKFKARDFYWYKRPYSKGKNNLYLSFNRYNYYNSDTAYKLSTSPDDNDFMSYLAEIALGTEFGTIKERMKRFKDLLTREQKTFNGNIKKEKEDRKNAKEKKNQLKKISNPELSFKEFLKNAETISWKKKLPTKMKDSTEQYDSDYKALSSYLNSLITSEIQNELSVKNQLNKIVELKEKLAQFEKEKVLINNVLKTSRLELNQSDLIKKPFDKARKYFNDKNSFKIKTIEDEIIEITKKIKEFDYHYNELDKLKIESSISKNESTISEYKKNIKENLKSRNAEKDKAIEQLRILKSTIDKLKSIIADIKYYGKEFVENKESIEDCPLCETPQTKQQLLSKLNKVYKNDDSSKDIEIFNKNISQLEKTISLDKERLSDLEKFEISVQNLIVDYDKLLLSEIFFSLKEKYKANTIRKRNLEKLESLFNSLKAKGYTKAEFDQIEKEFSDLSTLKFEINNKSNYEKEFKKLNARIEKINNDNRDNYAKVKSIEESIVSLLTSDYDMSKYKSQIDFKITELRTCLDYLEIVKEYIKIAPKNNIIEIKRKVDHLRDSFSSFKEAAIKFNELSLANEIIDKTNSSIKEKEPKLERINKGLAILNEILLKDSEEKVLESFFKKNIEEIKNIFSNIHSPKEFTGLEVIEGKILLFKNKGDKPIPITEISTGQRSALALSIFLALNKKLKNGPNLILFDDPVTFTDDLNILSFLDYLRSLLINENRQLVFATASKKIARLFEKKFRFMNDDFKQFNLERSDV
jgi:DNA repair exonuclease SbcCD ATPase subunit